MKTILATLLMAVLTASAAKTNEVLSIEPGNVSASVQFTNHTGEVDVRLNRFGRWEVGDYYVGVFVYREKPLLLEGRVILICAPGVLKLENPNPETIKDEGKWGKWHSSTFNSISEKEMNTILSASNLKMILRIDGVNVAFECAEMGTVKALAKYCADHPLPPYVPPAQRPIPSAVLIEIKRAAAKANPGNFIIQELEIKEQVAAYKRLRELE